jgi:putative ATP-dependent endonuclease of OLD family
MRIKGVEIENFRLLRAVAVGLEERTTLIVGRNNSGKTSIAELFRRLLSERSPSFKIEDFRWVVTSVSGLLLRHSRPGNLCRK